MFFSCSDELKKLNMPQYAQKTLEGAVVGCLREKYRESAHNRIELGAPCREEVSALICCGYSTFLYFIFFFGYLYFNQLVM